MKVNSIQPYVTPEKKAKKVMKKVALDAGVAATLITALALAQKKGKFTQETTNKVLKKVNPYLERAGKKINEIAKPIIDKASEKFNKVAKPIIDEASEKINTKAQPVITKIKDSSNLESLKTKIKDLHLGTKLQQAKQSIVDFAKENKAKIETVLKNPLKK